MLSFDFGHHIRTKRRARCDRTPVCVAMAGRAAPGAAVSARSIDSGGQWGWGGVPHAAQDDSNIARARGRLQ